MLKRPDIPLPPDPARKPVASYSAPVAPQRAPPPLVKPAPVTTKSRLSDPLVDPLEDLTPTEPVDSVATAPARTDACMAGADFGLAGEECASLEASVTLPGGHHHRGKGREPQGHSSIGLAFVFDEDQLESNVITGVGDRAAHLAMVGGAGVPEAVRAYPAETPRLGKTRPASRGECERRCGSDGFCDPSSPLGCGGIHCIDMF